jgi:hypothetical protein
MKRGARREAFFAPDDTCVLFTDLLGETCERYGLRIHGFALRSARGRGGHPARWLAAWWLLRATPLKQVEIAAALGTRPETVSRIIGRAARRFATDEQFAGWREALERGAQAARKDQ